MANQQTINLGRVKGSMWYTGTADNASAIASAITSAGYTPLKLDMYLNTENGNLYHYVPVGDVLTWTLIGNLRGARGEAFKVDKTYPSVAKMNSSYANDGLPLGAFVIIDTGNVDDEENARLYYKGDSQYVYLTDLSGAQGIKGDKGEQGLKGDTGEKGDRGEKGDTGAAAGFGTPTASVELLPTGSNPTFKVTATGENTEKVFNFNLGIPQGAKGEKGEQGEQGAKGDTGDKGDKGDKGDTGAAAGFGTPKASASVLPAGSNPTADVTTSGDATAKVFNFNFGLPKGDKGDKGDPGENGADGKTPKLSINTNGELIATFE